MKNKVDISAKLYQEDQSYTIATLIHKQLPQFDQFYWSYYKFKSPEAAAVWFFARYQDVPLVWYLDPTQIPLLSHLVDSSHPNPIIIPLNGDTNATIIPVKSHNYPTSF